MSRLCIATRGACSWRERLANPDTQWRRRYSAFETAVSWESAADNPSGLPHQIAELFRNASYEDPVLQLAIAEHKVDLPGGRAASQCDVWAMVKTARGMLSLTVEAKAREAFGDEILKNWLVAGGTEDSKSNREIRWDYVQSHLPKSDSFHQVRYQILHRCAASVIEAKRLGLQHAAFIVQAFNTPEESFQSYAAFCQALQIPAKRGGMAPTSVDGISLSVGWADCLPATDEQVASVI
jgi:uncharacterized protein DUF6946